MKLFRIDLINVKNESPKIDTEYIILGVGCYSLEFKSTEDEELKGLRECGLYSKVEFIEIEFPNNEVLLFNRVFLTEKGVKYYNIKCNDMFLNNFKSRRI